MPYCVWSCHVHVQCCKQVALQTSRHKLPPAWHIPLSWLWHQSGRTSLQHAEPAHALHRLKTRAIAPPAVYMTTTLIWHSNIFTPASESSRECSNHPQHARLLTLVTQQHPCICKSPILRVQQPSLTYQASCLCDTTSFATAASNHRAGDMAGWRGTISVWQGRAGRSKAPLPGYGPMAAALEGC